MKRILIKNLLKAAALLAVYRILLVWVSGSGLIAGIFCPGPQLPVYALPVIVLFFCLRLGVIFLPAVLLSRIVFEWLKMRREKA